MTATGNFEGKNWFLLNKYIFMYIQTYINVILQIYVFT